MAEFRNIKQLLHDNYEDGCELATRCWDCPLSRCRFEDPAEFDAVVKAAHRVKRVRDMRALGLTVEQASRSFGVVVRTIYRDKALYPHLVQHTNSQDLAAVLEYLESREGQPLQGRLFA